MTAKKEPWWKSRTLMTFLALAIVWGLWERACVVLGRLDAVKAVPFESLTQTVLWVVALLVASLAGIKSLERIFSFRREIASQTDDALEQVIRHVPGTKQFDGEDVS